MLHSSGGGGGPLSIDGVVHGDDVFFLLFPKTWLITCEITLLGIV
jgi:hypothetical protein